MNNGVGIWEDWDNVKLQILKRDIKLLECKKVCLIWEK